MMKTNLLKTAMLAAAFAGGSIGAWADGSWQTIFSEDYNDASTYNKFWTSGNTGRYTINQTQKSGDDYVMEVVPVSNGNNGTSATYTGLTSSNSAVESYQTAEDFRISFDFNFCYNSGTSGQTPFFQIMNSSGTEIVGFYATSKNSTDASLRLSAGGSSTGGTELATFSLFKAASTPTTYNTVTIYTTTKDGTKGTYMDVSWAGSEEATTYTIDASSVVHIGKMVHNTKRYYNHFVFDNLKVELYSESEIVVNPTANITAVNGTSRTITLSSTDDTYTLYYYWGENSESPVKYTDPITASESGTLSYYAQSTSGTKSEVQTLEVSCEAISLNAPSVSLKTDAISVANSMLSGASFTFNAPDNSSVLLKPETEKMEYTFTAEGGEESARTTIDATTVFTPTEKGTLTVYANTTGYTESSYSIPVSDIYVSNFTYDFSALTADDLSGWTSVTSGWWDGAEVYRSAASSPQTLGRLRFGNNSVTDVVIGWGVGRSGNGCQLSLRNSNKGEINVLDINNSTTGDADANTVYSTYIFATSGTGQVGNLTSVFYATQLNTVKAHTAYAPASKESLTISSAGVATYAPTMNVSVPEGVEAYTVTVADSKVTTTKIESESGVVLEKGKGYLLKAEAGDYAFVGTSADVTTVEANDLKAATEAVTADGKQYVLAKKTSGVGFYKMKEGVTIPAGKAYLEVSGDSNAKEFYSLFDEGGTTAITSVKSESPAETFYTLQGVKTTKPQKGLYIVNGKKVTIK